ncbi:MAG: AccI family restriction endonuclease [Actinomycetota bacterium]|jgi:hypothetical protein|nr:AccI family restriction endonuclease [Rubrobacter sp.]MDQ3506973.1 AccI family restriction endonuclease [Actinomycetota bacterium]
MAKPTRPPTFRGSDFAMRYAQGQWSEERIMESVNASDSYRALPYGRSQVGPENKEEIPEYWEKYIRAESVGKRPDILIVRREDFERLSDRLPEDATLATDEELAPFLDVAVCAIEAENSLWVAEKMPDYGAERITRKDFKAPTVIVKEQDAPELMAWQEHHRIPVCVVQVFYDRGYIIRLDEIMEAVDEIEAIQRGERSESSSIAELDEKENKKKAARFQKDRGVFITEQSYADSRTGTSSKKIIYRAHYSAAREFGVLDPNNPPVAQPRVMFEGNGKIMAYVHFEGGVLTISAEALDMFTELSARRL